VNVPAQSGAQAAPQPAQPAPATAMAAPQPAPGPTTVPDEQALTVARATEVDERGLPVAGSQREVVIRVVEEEETASAMPAATMAHGAQTHQAPAAPGEMAMEEEIHATAETHDAHEAQGTHGEPMQVAEAPRQSAEEMRMTAAEDEFTITPTIRKRLPRPLRGLPDSVLIEQYSSFLEKLQ